MIKHTLKRLIVRSPQLALALSYRVRKFPRIFLYHRFSKNMQPPDGIIESRLFEWQLAVMKRYCKTVSLCDYIREQPQGHDTSPITVIISVDDGYADFYHVAYPLLKKFRVPATFFVTVNFVLHREWLWPDRLRYLLENCMDTISFKWNGKSFFLDTSSESARTSSWRLLSDYCSFLQNDMKWELLSLLEKAAAVNIPKETISNYEPVTLQQLGELSENGIEIGSHTLSHPILSRLGSRDTHFEIFESKAILESLISSKINTFAYPSGRPADISPIVINQVEKAGYIGAVVTERNYGHIKFKNRFTLPRIGVNRDKVDFLWKLFGLEYTYALAKTHHRNKIN